MGVYGETAVVAANSYAPGQDPKECWEHSIIHFTNSKESRKKGCPKSAFLGLCEAGYVKGIPKGKYTIKGHDNKDYAIAGADIVLSELSVNYQPRELWLKIKERISTRPDRYNEQMDVVLALKNAGLLQKPD